MRSIKLICAGVLLCSLAACAVGPDVRTDYDHSANFAQYRSFAFMTPLATEQRGYSTLVSERLKTAVRAQMEMRGYVYAPQTPDLLVNMSARINEKVNVAPAPPLGPYYGYRAGFYGGWPGYAMGEDVYQYKQGTLNIDLIDARRKQMVWEGVRVSTVDDVAQASSPASLEQGVAEIFARYPFRAGTAAPQLPSKQPQSAP